MRTTQQSVLTQTFSSHLLPLLALDGSVWLLLSRSPLRTLVSIKRETRGAEPTRQALAMLQKWAASETATYGQLRERLCTLSVFHI